MGFSGTSTPRVQSSSKNSVRNTYALENRFVTRPPIAFSKLPHTKRPSDCNGCTRCANLRGNCAIRCAWDESLRDRLSAPVPQLSNALNIVATSGSYRLLPPCYIEHEAITAR